MEKRKLAKIPREEASEEMVRFAERAAGTHIVTTRDIEKDLLMVTFYPIGKLKKGEKGAQLRTFFSKNDYISQDLTSERVKWLTAAFDRMECIHLYEYHWDRDKGNRYTPNMFFWTDADIDRMAAMGIPEGTLPVGWWIGFQVTDADVWEKVKDGTYSMFSIEGKAERVSIYTKD